MDFRWNTYESPFRHGLGMLYSSNTHYAEKTKHVGSIAPKVEVEDLRADLPPVATLMFAK